MRGNFKAGNASPKSYTPVMDDVQIRLSAFAELNRRVQIHGTTLPWEEIIRTFKIGEEEIYIANRARGIFKPRQMQRGILSVKSTLPRVGRMQRYIDDRRGESLSYSFQGDDPLGHDNQRMKEAFEDQTPFIYFHGVAAGKYEALWPAYAAQWLASELKVEIQIGPTVLDAVSSSVVREEERRYCTHAAQQRIHQAAFREMVLSAYGDRCSLSGLPVRALLNAAHIYPDGHINGVATVTNGIAMSTLHHAAYDGNLIGIDPDGRIDVSDRIFRQKDGPLLENGLKALRGTRMRFPEQNDLRPDRDALAFRFDEFLATK